MITKKDLDLFEKYYDDAHDKAAIYSQREFIKTFPISRINKLTLDQYVIGKGRPTFCAWVEAKTMAWAKIYGATSFKFGIYNGKTKNDSQIKYRHSKKFGSTPNEAFRAVKSSLLDLLADGEAKNYEGLDGNKLSQMFKAKILSLYYPDIYLNVCSKDSLYILADELGMDKDLYISEYQRELINVKNKNKRTKGWSNPKFMSFLFSKFIRNDLGKTKQKKISKPKVRSKVDFDALNEARKKKGIRSEKYALKWEKRRLKQLGYESLIAKIDDRRDKPGYGYDYFSYTEPGKERYIEVKTLTQTKLAGDYSFYLSSNECDVSNSKDHKSGYYFYLVLYDKNNKPIDVIDKPAQELYADAIKYPSTYLVKIGITA